MKTLILFLALVCNQECKIDTNSMAEEMDIITPMVTEDSRYIVQVDDRVVYVNLYAKGEE